MISIVLSRHDFRENDQVIALYTQERGKLEVLARGVKKILSKNAAYLEPCFLVDVEIVHGKEIIHLIKAQPVDLFKNIRADLPKIYLVGYLMKLLDKLLKPEDADKRIFELTVSFLEFLDQTPPLNLPLKEGETVLVDPSSLRRGLGGGVNSYLILLDAFLLKLFSLLGFDISEVENMDGSMKKTLDLLLKNNWESLPDVLDKKVVQALHKIVHHFMESQSEQKLAYFSQI